jgi:hypothetical protein
VLPELDGWLLPPGRHVATLDEVRDRFVARAPYAAERAPLFDALRWYAGQVGRLFWTGSLWIDGGFVTYKPWAPPDDVDVTIVVRRALTRALSEAQRARLYELVTLQGVYAREPAVATPRVRPMAGMVDAFFCRADDRAQLAVMHETWSRVRGENGEVLPDVTKGYVEVKW